MTIYWVPNDATDPDSIDVWHVADDGSTSGPLTVDTSAVDGMPDSFGGIAPDAVRDRIGEFLVNYDASTTLWQQVVIDMLTLDYERGAP